MLPVNTAAHEKKAGAPRKRAAGFEKERMQTAENDYFW